MWAGQNSPHFCTVEKLGPTEGPNISTVFILNENMVGHNEVPIIPMVPTFRCTPDFFFIYYIIHMVALSHDIFFSLLSSSFLSNLCVPL